MIIRYEKSFKKQYSKLSSKQKIQFKKRLVLFVSNSNSVELRNHPLKGQYTGYWSINISGDLRAIYIKDGDKVIIFALVGTHSQLY